ncbi:MAG: hypothetical protein EHM61_21540 [Acidobacteria bacterium]|nr:MAG: hypothetical protein EHM61_21540 [Acidobacteriota bacterium]
MSIPFGEVDGVLVQVGDYLVFVDEQQPQNSFAMRRSDVRTLNGQEDMINVELSQPVRGRSGQMDRLTFRLQERAGVAGLTAWGTSGTTQQAGNTTTAGRTNSPNASNGTLGTYSVKHNHTMGECRGNLIIKQDGVAYESINEINHSRQWSYRDVREIERDNPYEMVVKPFAGDEYEFDFMGKGMDNNVYQTLTERVTAARVAE